MATSVQRTSQLTVADLKGRVDPDWCPGCGDFGVLAAIQKALVELQIPNHNVVAISGIGCSSNLPGFINTYGMHTLRSEEHTSELQSPYDIVCRLLIEKKQNTISSVWPDKNSRGDF